MQPQQSADVSKEQHLIAARERKRGQLQGELASARKAVRRRLKEVEGPQTRSDIQHKVPPDGSVVQEISTTLKPWTSEQSMRSRQAMLSRLAVA